MPIIQITTWPTPKETKQHMMQEITRIIHEISGAPLDKITVYLQEIEPSQWSEAGIIGDNKEFKTKSRRLTYKEKA